MVAKKVLIICLVVASLLLLLHVAAGMWKFNIQVEAVAYWFVLGSWVSYILFSKKTSEFSLKTAFILFGGGILLYFLTFQYWAEVVMRISLIGWMVGIGQALVEYKKEYDKKSG